MAGRKKQITLKDLSEHLQISPFTISKALSGKSGMSDETRELITRTARELGYRWRAESRPTQPEQQHRLAVVIPSRFISELNYFADLLAGIEGAAREAGWLLTVVTIDPDTEEAGQLPAGLTAAQGAIYLPMLASDWMKEALADGPPAVAITFPHRTWAVDSVVWDAELGVGFCVDHLVARGHRQIGYAGTPHAASGHWLRWTAFQNSLREHGLALPAGAWFLADGGTPDSYVASLRQALGDGSTLPPAILCDFEMVALAMTRLLGELGRTDVDLVCTDQLSPSTLVTAPMPHLYYHRDWVGRRAVERLLRRVEHPDEPYEQLRVAVTLRV